MTPQQQRDLIDLRRAAQARDQEQLQFVLKRLLRSLDYFVALSVPLDRAYRFVDIFESYYPEEAWPRQMLLAITSFGSAPDDSIAEMALQKEFPAPGAGNFLKAIYDITQAMQEKHTGDARIGYMTSAVVNAIMAELAESWYGDRLQDWQRVRRNQYNPDTQTYSDPDAAQIAYQFWTDPQTAALDTASWLEIADQIEKHLTRLETTE
jgi:hypothetical protein